MTIDVLIRTMRTRAGLSVRELAKKIGVVNQSIYNWENGDRIPSAEKLLAVAEACDHELLFRPKHRFYDK